MNVFISWSGELSRSIAEVLRNWLPNVIQVLEPFYSHEDIKAGTRWSSEISQRLQNTKIGIICLTESNLNAPWLMFEAGALSKQLDSRVCPILFGPKVTDVQGPLVQFQLKEYGKQGVFDTVSSINEQLGTGRLSGDVFQLAFDKWWPDLDKAIENLPTRQSGGIRSTRTDRDLLEEVLIRVRGSEISLINSDMVDFQIHSFKILADAIRYIGNKEKRDAAAHAMWDLQFPTQHFITKIADTDLRRRLAEAYAEAVSVFFTASGGSVNKDSLVKSLAHPSHGLITTAPLAPKAKVEPEN